MRNASYSYQLVPTSQTEAETETADAEHNQTQVEQQDLGQLLQITTAYSPKINSFLTLCANALVFLLPSFIQKYLFPHAFSSSARKLRKTSFLDGLRGNAALLIVIVHAMGDRHYWYRRPFTLGPFDKDENPQEFTSPLQLPFIRVIYNPEGMVPIFFVISGYVLSYRSIQIIRGTRDECLADSLFSSVFRRGFRLFVPSAIGLLLVQFQAYMGMIQLGYTFDNIWGYFGSWIRYMGEFFHLILDVAHHHGRDQTTLQQFWTIPVEFLCSMGVFIVLLGVSGLKTKWRVFCVLGLMIFFHCDRINGLVCFYGGLLTAEIEEIMTERLLLRNAHQNNSNDFELSHVQKPYDGLERDEPLLARLNGSRTWKLTSILYYLFWISALIWALVILGWPQFSSDRDPMLRPFINLGGYDAFISWAAILYVNCLFRLPLLQKIYTTSIAQYLGDISFSIYIIHFTIGHTVRPAFKNLADIWFGEQREGHFVRFLGNLWEIGMILLVQIPVADLFWRVVDIPSVRFAKWVERKCKKSKAE